MELLLGIRSFWDLRECMPFIPSWLIPWRTTWHHKKYFVLFIDALCHLLSNNNSDNGKYHLENTCYCINWIWTAKWYKRYFYLADQETAEQKSYQVYTAPLISTWIALWFLYNGQLKNIFWYKNEWNTK